MESVGGDWIFIVTDDVAKEDGAIKGQIRSYYLRLTSQRSFIFRIASSKFSYDDLWAEQQQEVAKMLGSIVFESNE